MTRSVLVRISKPLKEFVKNESQKTGLSEGKILELKFKEELPFIQYDKLKKK